MNTPVNLKFLFMENEAEEYKMALSFFKEALKGLANLIEPIHVMTPAAACESLRNFGESFHVFVADLLFPKPGDRKQQVPTGLEAVRAASSFRRLAIIAFSVAEDRIPTIRSDFKEAGGHLYVDKRVLWISTSQSRHQEIEQGVIKLLGEMGHIPTAAARLIWKAGVNIPLDAVIERIGKEVLEDILSIIEPDYVSFIPEYITPGRSGAVVLQIDGFKEARNSSFPDIQLLVKCATDKGKLQHEINGAPQISEPDSELYVQYKTREPVTAKGGSWHAIAAGFREKALTLRRWLAQSDTTKTQNVLFELFNGLSRKYRTGKIIDENAIALLTADLQYKARVMQALPDIFELIGRVLPIDQLDRTILEKFILHGQVINRPCDSITRGTYKCICHGDLHCDNILVSLNANRPWLIDPAERKESHWASDFALLSRDLWISALDSGSDSHFWEKLPIWRRAISEWSNGNPTTTSSGNITNGNILTALYYIRDNLSQSLGVPNCVRIWEFHAALIMEFLKASSDAELPTPKRALAVLAAYDLLIRLESELPSIRQ